MGKRAFRLQGDGLKERMLGKRIEKLSQETVALKEQAKALKSEIAAERASEAQMLKALKGRGKKRGRGVLRLSLAAGVAYLLGAKAGRSRYEQIRGWWISIRNRSQSTPAGRKAQELARAAAGRAEQVASKTSTKLQEAAKTTYKSGQEQSEDFLGRGSEHGFIDR